MNFHVEFDIRLGYSVQKTFQPIACFFYGKLYGRAICEKNAFLNYNLLWMENKYVHNNKTYSLKKHKEVWNLQGRHF